MKGRASTNLSFFSLPMYPPKISFAKRVKTLARQIFVVIAVVFFCLPKIGFCHCEELDHIGSLYSEETQLPITEGESYPSLHDTHHCACCQHECSHGEDTPGKSPTVPSRFNDFYVTSNTLRGPVFLDDCGSVTSKLGNLKRFSKQGIHALYSVFQI